MRKAKYCTQDSSSPLRMYVVGIQFGAFQRLTRWDFSHIYNKNIFPEVSFNALSAVTEIGFLSLSTREN